MIRSENTIAVPPGATIKEQLQDRGMSQKEFAARMDMTTKHISQLINGEVKLTPDVAVRLELVLSIPAKFWNKLEAIYQEKIIKARAENEMEEDQQISKLFPYNEMSKLGWVPETRKPVERVTNLRKYFEVVRLDLLKNRKLPAMACRKLGASEKSNYALLAWSQEAKLLAREREVDKINIQELESCIPQIRTMTSADPSVFCDALRTLLGECGIALVFLPHIKGSFLHGATFIDGKKVVLGMTVRGRDADKFWFSLFHELGHILLGHIGEDRELTLEEEKDADAYAANVLIPSDELEEFVENHNFSREEVIKFANKIGVDCGIVVGRLQNDRYINHDTLNGLKKQYVM